MQEHVRCFTIPETPISKNDWQRMHWAKRGRIKEAWEEWVWASVNEHKRMPRPLESVLCNIIVTWDKRGPLPDRHNLEMAFECIADGLVKAAIIRDDSGHQFERGKLKLLRGPNGETNVILRWRQ